MKKLKALWDCVNTYFVILLTHPWYRELFECNVMYDAVGRPTAAISRCHDAISVDAASEGGGAPP